MSHQAQGQGKRRDTGHTCVGGETHDIATIVYRRSSRLLGCARERLVSMDYLVAAGIVCPGDYRSVCWSLWHVGRLVTQGTQHTLKAKVLGAFGRCSWLLGEDRS